MGAVFAGIPAVLAADLVREMGLTAAAETGTHLGDSTRVLRGLVPVVWTVELSSDYLQRAQRNLVDLEGIHFLQGSSDRVFAELLPTLPMPFLFWLDAHWCDLGTAGSQAQCPVLAEIAAIDAGPSGAESVILIDDARFFLGAPLGNYRREDWPTFMAVVDALRARHPRYVTALADVIIAGPPGIQPVVERWHLNTAQDASVANAAGGNELASAVAAWHEAVNPTVAVAARRLIKALLPRPFRDRSHRMG